MDRASDSGSEGWGFESLPVYHADRSPTLEACFCYIYHQTRQINNLTATNSPLKQSAFFGFFGTFWGCFWRFLEQFNGNAVKLFPAAVKWLKLPLNHQKVGNSSSLIIASWWPSSRYFGSSPLFAQRLPVKKLDTYVFCNNTCPLYFSFCNILRTVSTPQVALPVGDGIACFFSSQIIFRRDRPWLRSL